MPTQPDPWPSMRGRVKKLEDSVARRASVFFGTGFHPTAKNGIESDDFDGDLDAGDAGTKGWAMNAVRAAFGELILRPGSIGNDALTNPVIPQSVWKGTTAPFGLAVAWSTLVSQALVVPAGVSSVQVIGFVRLVATNTTATKDYLYSDFVIEGLSCGGFATPVDAGDPGTSFCSFARTLTGLTPGDTITLSAAGSSGFAPWGSTDNVCQISASVTWYR